MNRAILTLRLRGKRDVLRARQRARQIARLLGYEFLEQSWIAACVLEMSRKAVQSDQGSKLVIHLRGNLLRIALVVLKSQAKKYRPLVFSLPNHPSTVDRNDLSWIIEELNRLSPLILFEEFRQQNLEILHLSNLLGCRLDSAKPGDSAA